jgi:hypothetical protein
MDRVRPVRVTVVKSNPRHRLTSITTAAARPPAPAPSVTTISLLTRSCVQSNAQTSLSSVPRGGVRCFVKTVISPFVNCVQPPVQACMTPATHCWGRPHPRQAASVAYKNRYHPKGLHAIMTPLSPPSRTNSACDPPGYTYAPESAPAVSFPQNFPYRQRLPAPPRGTSIAPESTATVESFRIARPGEKDVLCGARSRLNAHFDALVFANQCTYRSLPEKKKGLMARQLVDTVLSAGGRFLAKDDNSGLWYEIGWSRSCEIASQSLAASNGQRVMGKTSADEKEGHRSCEAVARRHASPLHSLASSITSSTSTSRTREAASSYLRLVEVPRIVIPRHLETTYRPQRPRNPSGISSHYHNDYHQTRPTLALPPLPLDHPGHQLALQLALLYDHDSRVQQDPPSWYNHPAFECMDDGNTNNSQELEEPQQESSHFSSTTTRAQSNVESQRMLPPSPTPTPPCDSRHPKTTVSSYPKLPLPTKIPQHSSNRPEQPVAEHSTWTSHGKEHVHERSSFKRPWSTVRKKEETADGTTRTNVVLPPVSPIATKVQERIARETRMEQQSQHLPQQSAAPAIREMMAPSILLQSRSYSRLGRSPTMHSTQAPPPLPPLFESSMTSSSSLEDTLFKSDTVSNPITATTTGALWRVDEI